MRNHERNINKTPIHMENPIGKIKHQESITSHKEKNYH